MNDQKRKDMPAEIAAFLAGISLGSQSYRESIHGSHTCVKLAIYVVN
jgi:hypothetical protein